MLPFEHASHLSQIKRLRALAGAVVEQYPIKVKTIDFIRYSINATFKITDTHRKKYQLRIHPKGHHTKNAILEEFKWLNCILKTTDIIVPTPLYSNEGKYLVEYKHPNLSEFRHCDMFEWLDGRFLWKSIDKKYAYNVGALIAKLHESGKKIKVTHRYYWDAEWLVGTNKARFANVDHLTGVSTKKQELITAARQFALQKLKQYESTNPDKMGLIHEDLNPNNIIIHHNHYGVIDFDDCGIGLYGVSFNEPLSAFEHLSKERNKKDYNVLKEALIQGYADRMPMTQKDINMIPYFLLARKLCAIGSLELRKNDPKMRPWFLKSIENAITYFKKLER
jgi:Ser/Thr protein kinase RdoA (MazF antagonist)